MLGWGRGMSAPGRARVGDEVRLDTTKNPFYSVNIVIFLSNLVPNKKSVL